MSSSNRVKLSVAQETNWGETPVAVALQEYAITATSLTPVKETVKSASLRSDRQVDAVPKVGQSANGNIDFEFSPSLKPLLDGVLFGDWVEHNTQAGTVALTNTAGVLTMVFSSGTDWTAYNGANLLKVTGSLAGNNGRYRVINRVDATKTLTVISTSGATVTSESVTVSCAYVRNGTVAKSYVVELGFEDLDKYIAFTGVRFSTFALTFASRQVITASLAVLAKRGLPLADASVGTVTPAGTLYPLSASANVGEITDSANVPVAGDIASFNVNIANNLRERPVVGSEFSKDHGVGEFGLTGQLSVYFQGGDLYNAFINHTDVALNIPITADDGTVFNLELPRIIFGNSPVAVTGINTDVMQTIDYTALRHAVKDYTVQIDFI